MGLGFGSLGYGLGCRSYSLKGCQRLGLDV